MQKESLNFINCHADTLRVWYNIITSYVNRYDIKILLYLHAASWLD